MTPDEANKKNKKIALDRGSEQAFPLSTGTGYPHNGLTKREWMSTQIMIGLLSDGYGVDSAVQQSIIAVDKLLIALHVNQK